MALRARDTAQLLRNMTASIDLVDETGPDTTTELFELEARVQSNRRRYPLAANFMLPVAKAHKSVMIGRQRLVNARLGLRVCRYRAKNGTLPARLDDVLDPSMATLPIGYFSGKAMHYDRTIDGFVIWDKTPDKSKVLESFRVSFKD